MGRPNIPFYGDSDVGSAIEDIEKIIIKIKTNKFGSGDILALYEANAELIKAVLEDEYKD